MKREITIVRCSLSQPSVVGFWLVTYHNGTKDKVCVIETYAKMDLFSEKMVGLGVGILEEINWWFHC